MVKGISGENPLQQPAVKLFLKTIEKDILDETIILTPCKQDRINSTFEINKIIQEKLLPLQDNREIKYGKKSFRIGDKVIQRSNNYEKSIFNGEIGYVQYFLEKININL